MDQVRIPNQIKGQWAGKRSTQPEDGVWFLARRSFQVSRIVSSADFWITTGGAYQLIVNSILVGCGPRPHHLPDVCYADQYDLGNYLTEGENVIAILFRVGPVDAERHPGFWCQLELDGRPEVWSDQNWDLLEAGRGILAPVVLRGNDSLSVTLDREIVPIEWFRPDAVLGKRWSHPDWLRTIAMPGGQIAFHPLWPTVISEDPIRAQFAGCGHLEEIGTLTGFNFHDTYTTPGVYLGAAFRFEEAARDLNAFFSCDVPFRIFCNHQAIADGRSADHLALQLPLAAGWNRILVYVENRRISSGVLWQIPDEKPGIGHFLVDTLEGAQPGWNLLGPLRLPLARAAAGIRLEGFPVQQFRKRAQDTYCNAAWLAAQRFRPAAATNAFQELKTGDGQLFRLDCLRYGLFSVNLTAPSGACIDIAVGSGLGADGYPVFENGRRQVYTLRTSEGANRLIMPVPSEAYVLLLSVRRSDVPVSIQAIQFHEMSRLESRETSFKCSDPGMNAIWEAGLQSIRRAAAYLEPVWSEDLGAKLVDQCVQAFNIISIFNDYQASRGRLQVLLNSQLESGELPICTHGRSMPGQLAQLFALPLWLLYHHRSGNDPELLAYGLPAVDRLVGLFDGMLDPGTGLLRVPNQAEQLQDLFTGEPVPQEAVPVLFNICYCRTLLSCGEIYRQLGYEENAVRCFRNAVLLADHLRQAAMDPATGLLARSVVDGKRIQPDDLHTNLMALLAGIHDPTEFQRIFYHYFNFNAPFAKQPFTAPEGYFNFFFLEMLFALNQSGWALRYLKDFYTARLDAETKSWHTAPGGTAIADGRLQEGRFVVPNAFIMREAAGIRAAEPGYGAVFFHPPLDTLRFAEIVLPTVYGQIHLLWALDDDGKLEVTIDSTYPLRVLPELSDAQLANTTFHLDDNITLLDLEAPPQS